MLNGLVRIDLDRRRASRLPARASLRRRGWLNLRARCASPSIGRRLPSSAADALSSTNSTPAPQSRTIVGELFGGRGWRERAGGGADAQGGDEDGHIFDGGWAAHGDGTARLPTPSRWSAAAARSISASNSREGQRAFAVDDCAMVGRCSACARIRSGMVAKSLVEELVGCRHEVRSAASCQ